MEKTGKPILKFTAEEKKALFNIAITSCSGVNCNNCDCYCNLYGKHYCLRQLIIQSQGVAELSIIDNL